MVFHGMSQYCVVFYASVSSLYSANSVEVEFMFKSSLCHATYAKMINREVKHTQMNTFDLF